MGTYDDGMCNMYYASWKEGERGEMKKRQQRGCEGGILNVLARHASTGVGNSNKE
jgi:hypothetical protein